jgi:hypothetical protein
MRGHFHQRFFFLGVMAFRKNSHNGMAGIAARLRAAIPRARFIAVVAIVTGGGDEVEGQALWVPPLQG